MLRNWVVLFIGMMVTTPAIYAAPALQFVTVKEATHIDSPRVMVQDYQGFIWIGTQSGLHRFDGYQSRYFQYTPNTPGSLPNNQVVSLFEDAQRRLWVGTRGGLALFVAETSTFKTYLPPVGEGGSEQNRVIQKISPDGKNGLWLATRDGLQHFNPDTGEFQSYRHDPAQPDSLANNNIQTLTLDRQGGLWIATWPSGLDYLPAGTAHFQHQQGYDEAGAALENNIKSLYVDSRQRLWIGTEAGVFLKQPGEDWSQKKQLSAPGIPNDFRAYDFVEDDDGIVWVASFRGLLRFDDARQQFDIYQHQAENPNSLADSLAFALLLDRSGTLWVSTAGGLSRADLSLRGFEQLIPRVFNGADDKVDNVVRAIAPAGSGRLWIGGWSKLLLIDLKARTVVKNIIADKLPVGIIYSLFQQPDGPLWLGSSKGLFRIDAQRRLIDKISLGDRASNYVNEIAADGRGRLWLGTGGGLIEYDPKAGILRTFRHDPLDPGSLANNSVNTMMIDRSGKIWLSGGEVAGGGLDVLDPGTGQFRHYRFDADDSASLANDFVTDIREDRQGNVWLATLRGLSQARVGENGELSFRNYDSYSGLDPDSIKAINFDQQGKLWLSTSDGMSLFDPAKSRFINFNTYKEGSASNYSAGASFIDHDGVLYFGSFQGLTVVRAEQVQHNQMEPIVAITDINVLNRSLADGVNIEDVSLKGGVTEPKGLTLPWQAAVFSLKFAALHFSDPGRNRYAYKLDGFDRDWVETDSSNRVATYTNLNPGNYLFRVKASNNTGVWNETGVSLPIIVTPAHWQTVWFRVAMAGLLLGLMLSAILWRFRQLRRIQANLEDQVVKRTEELVAALEIKSTFLSSMSHEIRTPMNAIMGMIHLALLTDLNAKQRNYLDKINTSAKWLLSILNDILDFSKLEAGKLKLEHIEFSLETVIQYLVDVTSSLLVAKPLVLSIEVEPEVPDALIGDPLRLGQVLLNLLSNAVKFTEQGTVILRVQLQSSDTKQASLRFSVIDTGIGLSLEQQSHLFSAFSQADDSTTRKYGGTGLGLTISKELVAEMGGTIEIESRLGLGSSFYFTVSLDLPTASVLELPIRQPAQQEPGSLKLLFVEDDPAIREMIPEILDYEGIQVDLAANGAEAVAMIDKNAYSMVLMDCEMPGMDGFAATRTIRADPRFADLPIIAMTGNGMAEDRERCLASGMNDYMTKPVDWDRFISMLKDWAKPVAQQVQNQDAEIDETDSPMQPLALGDDRVHRQLIGELSMLLAGDEFISDELLAQLKALFPAERQAEYTRLVQYILDTDYPKAKSALNALAGFSNELLNTSDQDQRPTILVVDDTRVNLEVLALLLNRDYQVKVAGNGRRALDIAQYSSHLDLVLLDVRMPRMDGYEVCQRLHDNPLTAEIPVIFVTAAFDRESEIHGLQQGAMDYISKPINPAIVLLRVRNQILIRQYKKELQCISHYDALTGTHSRVLLADRLKQATAQAKRARKLMAVCYLDLDNFKSVNDSLGQQAGDRVLAEMARRMGTILRESDTVAHLGGDQYVVLLPNLAHAQECVVILRRLQEAIALSISVQQQSVLLTASVGISVYPSDNSNPDVLINHAELAMQVAKLAGKNCFHLYNPIDASSHC